MRSGSHGRRCRAAGASQSGLWREAGQVFFQGGQVDRIARAAHHADELAGSDEVRRAVPGGQVTQRIATHQVDQVGPGILLARIFTVSTAKCGAGRSNSTVGKFEIRGSSARWQVDHCQALFERSDGMALFMWRIGCQHPQQPVRLSWACASAPGSGDRGAAGRKSRRKCRCFAWAKYIILGFGVPG